MTDIRVLLLEVRLSDVRSFPLLWAQLILFMRKIVLLKMDSFTCLSPLFPDDKMCMFTSFVCFCFCQFRLSEPTGQFLPNLTASLTCQSYQVFQIFVGIDGWISEGHHLVTSTLGVKDEEFTCDPFCLEPTIPPVHGTSSTITPVIEFLLTST